MPNWLWVLLATGLIFGVVGWLVRVRSARALKLRSRHTEAGGSSAPVLPPVEGELRKSKDTGTSGNPPEQGFWGTLFHGGGHYGGGFGDGGAGGGGGDGGGGGGG